MGRLGDAMTTDGNFCPSWHFLPGPYANDSARIECPDKDTHKAQRQAWDAAHTGRSVVEPE